MKLTLACVTLGVIVLSTPAFPEDAPGRKVYDRTCRSCHGPEGAGEQMADNFYKVRIPRLNSAAVQAYTDAQLSGIIMGGKGKMEPVRMGAPAAPHRKKLTGDEIEQVVAHIRTFKKK
jgi:cytochrome c553